MSKNNDGGPAFPVSDDDLELAYWEFDARKKAMADTSNFRNPSAMLSKSAVCAMLAARGETMDAETMIEKLNRAEYDFMYRGQADRASVAIAEVIAALRAQAKEEPARWERRLSRGSYVGAWEAISHHCERHDDRADGWVREYRPLYTAPPPGHAVMVGPPMVNADGSVEVEYFRATPPDHAEALAEALQEIMSYEGGAESPLEDQYVVDRAQSALTRYKERTNG